MAGFFLHGSKTYLLGRLVDEALPLLLPTALSVSHLLGSGVLGLQDRQPHLRLLCIKQKGSQNQRRELTNVGTTSTVGKVLKDQKTRCGKKEIIRKNLQLREPIQRFPATRLALPPLRALHGLYGLSHKLRDRPRLIILPYVELEVAACLSLLDCGLPKGVPNRLTLVPVRNVSLTHLSTEEEKVILPMLQL
ncbi:LOW QUALITY PROTEIN: hypothetical protein Cgig2_030769 [Carnegiea gigantea]|uniref:Uncharacterized protein n=1 Tax=Carnegiea gigantea TaxID=171969 RepID=A0A9Q1KSS0_9CARY|nr:LOW QUALITY PROTEIN: hypothetical protein Cgig2_030769 [Carnegiea gigantea]